MRSVTLHKPSCIYNIFENKFLQMWQHVDGVKCRKFFSLFFFSGLISIMCLIVRIFVVGASRFVVGALYSFAPLGYGPDVYSEVRC